jgi:hypothetical protein
MEVAGDDGEPLCVPKSRAESIAGVPMCDGETAVRVLIPIAGGEGGYTKKTWLFGDAMATGLPPTKTDD